jgi:hypothetical protein
MFSASFWTFTAILTFEEDTITLPENAGHQSSSDRALHPTKNENVFTLHT